MKNIVRILFVVLIAAFAVIACEDPAQETPVKVSLNKSLISNLPVGSSQTLDAKLDPEGAAVTVVWTSDNEEVAVVNEDGVVTGVAPGEAVITASVDKESATCKVVVTAVKPTKIEINPENSKIEKGLTLDLQLIVTPSNAVTTDLEWSSNNLQVASVADGVVTALSVGKATITAKCNDGELAAVCHIEVVEEGGLSKVPVFQIQLPASLTLSEGEETSVVAVVLPEDATDKSLTFSSNNPECVSVDPQTGLLKALKAGVATVTATANDGSGASASCVVRVNSKDENGVELETVRIVVDGNATDLQVDHTLQLVPVFFPSDYKPKSVSWFISKYDDLASVDQNGVVTGLSAVKGSDENWTSVIVTVNADGKESSYSIRVIPKQPEGIEVSLPEEGWIRVGQEWDFNPRVLPEGLGYGVTCSIMKPGNKFTSDSKLSSDVPGTIAAQFAVATHEDLVYSGYRRDVSLNVLPYWVESISLPETQEMEVGGSLVLSPEFTSDVDGVQPTYKDVKWSSSDQSVASINERTGEIIAHAAGQTTIVVTTANEWSVPGGQAQKSATCVLTVKAADSGLNVGDYFYSDGTWSSELQSGKTVVGVVFAKANATTADPVLAKDFPNCTHGLVLGLTEYVDQDFGSVSCYNGHGYYTNLGYDASSIVDVEKQNGYGNSKSHRDLNASKPDYVALFNAESGVVATQTNAVATPSGASSWYVPSYKEMSMILANYDTINAAIVSAGGMAIATPYPIEDSWDGNRTSDWYWTSTIYGIPYGASYDHYKYAFDISKGAWTTSQQSSAKCKVRVVFAF